MRDRVTMDLTEGEPDPSFPNAHDYVATLHYRGRTMVTPFHTGSAWTEDPTAAEVLEHLADTLIDPDQSFDDFCEDFGDDTDSRRALAMFNALRAESEAFRALMGDALDDLAHVAVDVWAKHMAHDCPWNGNPLGAPFCAECDDYSEAWAD